ncbi:ester cyclase [Streptomyces sp. I05A-00742]|uniref:ester cyclase n=1 Tax=Streptomyces sp. I05A-00742 TaxID=2732853 RepID=UPI001489F405|nr:ester cyclase [Streptomyces sp. I05A-00742]
MNVPPRGGTAGRPGGLRVWDSAEDLRRTGLARDPEPWEDGLRETPRPGTFEWWYFDVACDDGTCVVIVFETKALSASAGPLAPRLSLTIRTPDGHVQASRTPYGPGQFRASRDHCDVALGPHHVRGDLDRYRIHARTPLAAVDLTLTAIAPPSRVGTGFVGLAGDPGRYLGWLVAVPRGTVEGRLTVRRRSWEVHGLGYHDKNWGTLDLGGALEEWHWARVHAGEFTVACAELRAPPDRGRSRAPLFVLTRGTERLAATATGAAFTPHTTAHPHHAEIRWADRVRVTLGSPRDLNTRKGDGPTPYRRFSAPAEITTGLAPARRKAVGTAIAEHAVFHPTAGRPPAAPPEPPATPSPHVPRPRPGGSTMEAPRMTDLTTAPARLAHAWSSPDSGAFGSLFTQDATYADIGAGRTHRGRAAITEWHRSMRTAVPDLTARVDDSFTTATGDACALLTWTGTHTTELFGLPGTGRRFTVGAASVFTLTPDGSIVRCADYYNLSDLERQLGHRLAPRGR